MFRFKENLPTHFFYITGILVIVNIFIVTHKFYFYSDVVTFVGFGTSLTSLVLAVLAIIYAIYSNQTFEKNISKLDDASDKIEKYSNLISNLPVQIQDLSDKVDYTKSIFSENILKSDSITASKLSTNVDENKHVFTFILKRLNSISFYMIYLYKLAKYNKSNLRFNFEELSTLFGVNYNVFKGMMAILFTLGLIDVFESGNKLILVGINTELVDIYDEIFFEKLLIGDEESISKRLNLLNNLRLHLGLNIVNNLEEFEKDNLYK